ncbi:Transposase [Mucilaginibacter sp. OK268]|nr:IS1595 family transposase [Mucilaginibacter sp. OK268]SDP90526.1 Transposase [Mucilaginibacter sp. OK268]
MEKRFNSLLQLIDFFKDESICKEYLAQQRWGNTVTCPHCKHNKVYVTNRGYKCADKACYKKFSVTTGTIYENTKISLRTWFAAMYLLTAHKKGISSHQLARDLNITQRTAWFVLHRIREMLKEKAPKALSGDIEVDETFVGGKNKNRHKDKKIEGSQGRSNKDKKPVLGIVQKKTFEIIERPHKVIAGKTVKEKIITEPSRVICQVIDDTDAVTLQTILTSNVEFDSTIVSDAYKSYIGLELTYNHIRVKHTEGEDKYKTVGEHHTNTIEGFWTSLKRSYIGIYHYMSPKHLQRYCDEMSFRYNTVNSTDCFRFEQAVGRAENARITYKQLIGDGKKGRKEDSTLAGSNFRRQENIKEEINHERFRGEAEFRGNISGKSEF